ncbi:hypothetical protein AB7849_02795 [Rhodanobacter sp. 115]|uniref:hypothetical protein n=1 Tax=Rhodanobacter sp. FW021-MT20 TaxID=1162282 RepID=UPI0002D9CEBD|nr:hypothetical protein [Rhodanobacter sp. 115]
MALLLAMSSGGAVADGAGWPDTVLARTQALALLETFNADLLGHDSATLTLERWCAAHGMATPATVLAYRVRGRDKPLPPDMRQRLDVGADEPVRYRRVRLACGDHVLSEADNWYLPNRLTAAMNDQLDHSDVPFGKVVRPLHFRRKTLSARLLWSPLPAGWEMRATPLPAGTGRLAIPHEVLQHRALLYDAAGHPFSALVETYTDQVLAFPLPSQAVPTLHPSVSPGQGRGR